MVTRLIIVISGSHISLLDDDSYYLSDHLRNELLALITYLMKFMHINLEGVAVGCGWQTFVAYVNIGCYYIVGVPLGVLLGFYFKLGAKGIWSGMLGGTVMQTIILIWITARTDWNKEVESAQSRLNTWGDDKKEALLE